MNSIQPTGIQIHLSSGRKQWFYQSNAKLVSAICENIDSQIFKRSSLVIEGADEVTSFPGHSLIGITVLISALPDSFYEREKASKTVISQISSEAFQYKRLELLTKAEGRRSMLLSEIEFSSSEKLFLEFSEVAVSGMDERNVLNHLFTHPAIFCRRADSGFSIWNTSHIVSWSHYPKLEAPRNAWIAESFIDPGLTEGRLAKML